MFRSSEEDFKKTVKGYLKADADRVEVLRQELNVGDRKIIGIFLEEYKVTEPTKEEFNSYGFGKIFRV